MIPIRILPARFARPDSNPTEKAGVEVITAAESNVPPDFFKKVLLDSMAVINGFY
jgi:hypothetical protein